MKLSICIPVYNFDVRPLVQALYKEIQTKNLVVEIILIDDASDAEFVRLNSEILPLVKELIFLKENIGRSAIRNLFLKYVSGDYLLFLDCDGQVVDSGFINAYLTYLNEHSQTQVLYGGRQLSDASVSLDKKLRWTSATKRENLALEKRLSKPCRSFQTNNFIIKRELFQQNPFCERLRNYGYEDLVFAQSLKQGGIKIHHCNNPVVNIHIESNTEYLKKVEQSMDNLSLLVREAPHLVDEIKVVQAYYLLSKLKIAGGFVKMFPEVKHQIRDRLQSGTASLYWLDFYKLGLLSEKLRSK